MPALVSMTPVGISAMYDVLDITYLLATNATYDKGSKGLYEKGDSKAWYKAKRKIPYLKSALLMQNPYKAASSYQYGRSNISR